MRPWIAAILAGLLGTANGSPAPGRATAASDAATHAGFAVRYRGLVMQHRIGAVFVLPEQPFMLEVARPGARRFELRAGNGTVTRLGAAAWRWHSPPAPGLYPLHVVEDAGGDSITLNAFVLVLAAIERGEYLNGYRIGRYPARPLRGLAAYAAPRGFVEVTAANRDVPVSPHFRLGDFLTKQQGDYPKYLVLDERLLLKLEYLLALVRAGGHPTAEFHVMSGYRTPYYNRAIGNVGYSRHLYGAAADIFVDVAPRDGMMDDLSGDGRVDLEDARVLRTLIERQVGAPEYQPFLGGLAIYPATRTHGPFVHVDVRGYRARW